MTQTMLVGFSNKALSSDEFHEKAGFRPWNRVVLDWDVEYQGYSRPDDSWPDAPVGFVDFHLIVELAEAMVTVRDKKTYKKVERPGYKVVVTQNMALPDEPWESYVVYDEEFRQKGFGKAVDAFMRELLNIQSWVDTAESRARLIPDGKDVFECPFCGWVTDKESEDITCLGCGKRFWSEKLMRVGDER